jgi:hypothetical protein
MLGQREKKTFLNISGGKVVKRTDGGKVETYDYVEGDLERIYQRDREFRGEKVPYWYLDLRDSRSGELYSLGINASSGVWRSIILSLGSCSNFLLPIRISPYHKGEYDRVSVYSGGERLDWIADLPPVEEIEVSPGRKIKSVDKREEFISQVVQRINKTLGTE